jgi:hypothetical protein
MSNTYPNIPKHVEMQAASVEGKHIKAKKVD